MLIELFDVIKKDALSETYLRDAVQKLVDILQVKYGAPGLLSEGLGFINFVQVGIIEVQAVQIGRLSEDKGILGMILEITCLDD